MTRRTFLVECYLPSLDRAEVSAAAERAEAAAREIAGRAMAAGGEGGLAYLGAMLVAQDEVVFHAFSADDAVVVDAACRQAAIPFERIVESEAIPGVDPLSAHELLRAIEQPPVSSNAAEPREGS